MRFENAVVIEGAAIEHAVAHVSDFARAHEWRTEVTASAIERCSK